MPYKRLKIAKGWIDWALAGPLKALARIGLKPVHLTLLSLPAGLLGVYLLDKDPVASAALIGAYICLDVLDGTLARVSNQVTSQGAKLDFFFDRLVAAAFLIKLYITGEHLMLPAVGLALILAITLEDLGMLKRKASNNSHNG